MDSSTELKIQWLFFSSEIIGSKTLAMNYYWRTIIHRIYKKQRIALFYVITLAPLTSLLSLMKHSLKSRKSLKLISLMALSEYTNNGVLPLRMTKLWNTSSTNLRILPKSKQHSNLYQKTQIIVGILISRHFFKPLLKPCFNSFNKI